jgi:hypothetical protein
MHDGWPHSSSFLAESQCRLSSSDPGQSGARGTFLAFAFVGGGGASKQASKQARQGKARQHAPHFSMRYLTKLTHISPTNKSSPKWRADPTSPTFASWNGLRLWPLAAPHENARARAQEPTLKSGTKTKRKGPCAASPKPVQGTAPRTAQHTSLHRVKGRPIAFDRWHGGLLEAKSVPQDCW